MARALPCTWYTQRRFFDRRIRITIFEALVRAFLSLSRRINVKGYTSKFGPGVAYFAAKVCNFSRRALQVHFRFPNAFIRYLYPRGQSTKRNGAALEATGCSFAHALYLFVNITLDMADNMFNITNTTLE